MVSFIASLPLCPTRVTAGPSDACIFSYPPGRSAAYRTLVSPLASAGFWEGETKVGFNYIMYILQLIWFINAHADMKSICVKRESWASLIPTVITTLSSMQHAVLRYNAKITYCISIMINTTECRTANFLWLNMLIIKQLRTGKCQQFQM